MRNRELAIDLLVVLGLAFLAGGLFMAYGWPLTLIFVGATLITLGGLLAFAATRRAP